MDDNHLAAQMPQTIGRYQVQESIGFGAMGAVYKAFDPLIKRTLAIKTIRLDIPKQSPQYKSFIERFYHEARISGTLSHPNIVTLFDIGEEGGLPYLAMEFVEGETIASLLDRGVRFKPEKVIGLVSQIASAIDYAHSKGVIHRDIKPSNLILYEAERVKVTDFGIAKLVDAEMTQSGTLLGTPSYMSPEQAMGDKLDGRSDIFSLGVCAFEMLSGEQPFPGNNVTSILYKLVHVDPVEPANLEMSGLVPEKWHQVFNKVLAKTPDDRYQTASEFVQDLEYCLGAWFGSAMGDDAAGEAAPEATPGAVAAPVLEEGATVVTGAAGSVPPPVSGPTEERTILMKPAAAASAPAATSAPAVAEGATILMKSAPPPPAASRAAESPSTEPKTILLKTPPVPDRVDSASAAAPASEEHEHRTIVLKPPAAPPRPDTTVRSAAMGTTQRPQPVLDEGRTPSLPARPARPSPPPAPEATPTPADAPEAVPVEKEPRKGAPFGLILGGVGAALLLLVVVTGVLVYRKFARAPAPIPTVAPTTTLAARVSPILPTPPPPAPTTGTIHIESQPPGASVTVNGEPKGVTPVDLPDVALGPYQVALELRGYAPASQMVTLTAGATRADVSVPLSRTAPLMGTADLVSNPAGALVQIDGSAAGQTPVTDRRLKVGSHKVDMAKDGYEPWSGTLTVPASRKGRLEAQLKAIPKPVATPTPEVVDANHVYAEGEVDTPPKKVSGRSAEYPSSAPALKRGQRASVTVSFVVTDTGDVSDVQVTESGGPQLDEAVASAFRTWKFTPGVKRGLKVKVKVSRRHTFLGG